MNQIREVIDQVYREFESIDHDTALIVCMERYAELYAKRCLEIAAKEAGVTIENYYNQNDDEDIRAVVDTESIIGIELAEHI